MCCRAEESRLLKFMEALFDALVESLDQVDLELEGQSWSYVVKSVQKRKYAGMYWRALHSARATHTGKSLVMPP